MTGTEWRAALKLTELGGQIPIKTKTGETGRIVLGAEEHDQESVFISKNEHLTEPPFVVLWKPTLGCKSLSILKGAKETIPPRDVSVIELVDTKLMVNGMMLGPLKKVADPTWRAQIAVVEILPQYREDVKPGRPGRGHSQEREQHSAGKY